MVRVQKQGEKENKIKQPCFLGALKMLKIEAYVVHFILRVERKRTKSCRGHQGRDETVKTQLMKDNGTSRKEGQMLKQARHGLKQEIFSRKLVKMEEAQKGLYVILLCILKLFKPMWYAKPKRNNGFQVILETRSQSELPAQLGLLQTTVIHNDKNK